MSNKFFIWFQVLQFPNFNKMVVTDFLVNTLVRLVGNGYRKKSPWKTPPEPKPIFMPNLTLTLPLIPHRGLFSGGIIL